MKTSIAVAVADPILHPEATHIVAAAGLHIIDVTTPEELRVVAMRARAVVVDKHMATELGSSLDHPHVLFVAGDPGPVDWQAACRVGAAEGFVIPAEAPELLQALGKSHPVQHQSAPSIGILGAAGGAGASTLAVGVARQCTGATLIDADPFSGGIDLLLGAEDAVGARWNDLSLGSGVVDGGDLRQALPESNGLRFLSSVRSQGALLTVTASAVVAAVISLRTQPVVVDLSLRLPNWADVVSSLSTVVVVIPAELRAVSVARELGEKVSASQGVQAVAVVRHRGWSGLSVAEVERTAALPVIGEIAHAPSLIKSSEMAGVGACPRPLRKVVAAILKEAGG